MRRALPSPVALPLYSLSCSKGFCRDACATTRQPRLSFTWCFPGHCFVADMLSDGGFRRAPDATTLSVDGAASALDSRGRFELPLANFAVLVKMPLASQTSHFRRASGYRHFSVDRPDEALFSIKRALPQGGAARVRISVFPRNRGSASWMACRSPDREAAESCSFPRAFSAWPRAAPAPPTSAPPTRASCVKRARTPTPTSGTSPMPSSARLSLYEDQAQKDEAVKIMIAKLEDGQEPIAIRAAIIRSLGNLGDRRARKVILRGVKDTDNAHDPRRGLSRARQGRLARRRDDPRQDHDDRQARRLPDRRHRGDRQPEIEGTKNPADPPRRHGPRRSGHPLSVPRVSAHDHRERLRHRSCRLETRAPSVLTRRRRRRPRPPTRTQPRPRRKSPPKQSSAPTESVAGPMAQTTPTVR